MLVQIETTHDLARWIQACIPKSHSGIAVSEVAESLLQGPPETWKKCKKCGGIRSITEYDTVWGNRDGRLHICKTCRRKRNASYTRRKRAGKKIPSADLAEIQRVRQLKGLEPLPLGEHAPKRGRPKNG